jgi:hypothetical protein
MGGWTIGAVGILASFIDEAFEAFALLFVVAGGLIVAGALVVRGPRPGSGAENADSSAWTPQRIGLLLVGAAWMIFGWSSPFSNSRVDPPLLL